MVNNALSPNIDYFFLIFTDQWNLLYASFQDFYITLIMFTENFIVTMVDVIK